MTVHVAPPWVRCGVEYNHINMTREDDYSGKHGRNDFLECLRDQLYPNKWCLTLPSRCGKQSRHNDRTFPRRHARRVIQIKIHLEKKQKLIWLQIH